MQTQNVAVAVVSQVIGGVQKFLVTHNPNWSGYAFPMKAVDRNEVDLAAAAIAALSEDLGLKLPNANAEELEHFGRYGESKRSGKGKFYFYSIFAVDPGQALTLPTAHQKSPPPLFVDYKNLAPNPAITWSTTEMVRDFVEDQEVALAVISRRLGPEREFLLMENNNYGGLFFPCQRIKTAEKPGPCAAETVANELGYEGDIMAERVAEVSDVHFSNRYGLERRFLFHVCDVRLPLADLGRPGNAFEQGLAARGKRFYWLTRSAIANAVHKMNAGKAVIPAISATLAAVWLTVDQAVPD